MVFFYSRQEEEIERGKNVKNIISANSMLTGQPARMELNMGRETETNEAGMERPRKRPKMRIIATVRYNRLTCIVL